MNGVWVVDVLTWICVCLLMLYTYSDRTRAFKKMNTELKEENVRLQKENAELAVKANRTEYR